MKILNLTNLEKSDIKYKISKFPDGQQQITIDKEGLLANSKLYSGLYYKYCQINSRLNNFQDLELIVCTVKSLRNLGVKDIHLYTPYFMGARSDRQFEEGSNNYLKDVICPIINSLNFESVTVIDSHSDVLEACLNKFKKLSNEGLVKYFFREQYNYLVPMDKIELDNCILISPDAGASKKIYKLAEQIGYKGDIITCSKDRDVDGKLTKLVIPVSTIVNKDYIIIDDICDGGATFLQIAKTLKPRLHKSNKLYLIVTHGIFSKGYTTLSEYFDGIYCTNSYSDLDNGFPETHIVKQLNVF